MIQIMFETFKKENNLFRNKYLPRQVLEKDE